MRLLHEIAIFQTVKSKVIISLFETVRLSVSISLRNLYNSLNSIKEKLFFPLNSGEKLGHLNNWKRQKLVLEDRRPFSDKRKIENVNIF